MITPGRNETFTVSNQSLIALLRRLITQWGGYQQESSSSLIILRLHHKTIKRCNSTKFVGSMLWNWKKNRFLKIAFILLICIFRTWNEKNRLYWRNNFHSKTLKKSKCGSKFNLGFNCLRFSLERWLDFLRFTVLKLALKDNVDFRNH